MDAKDVLIWTAIGIALSIPLGAALLPLLSLFRRKTRTIRKNRVRKEGRT